MKALRGASRENLLELDVVGPVIADAVMAFFSDERHGTARPFGGRGTSV